ncbi:MAG: hypothetical protein ICCCNLDF_02503 [Planctomycetes bacterium]|nr:hypothetical protein [Planctomycetota bacterium]
MTRAHVHTVQETFTAYVSELDLDTEPQVELFQDRFPKSGFMPGTIRVLCLCEPPVIKDFRKKLKRYGRQFDHILTFDPWVLKRFPQAHKFVYGTAMVHAPVERREFSISTVIGTKLITEGHRLRHKFWKKSGKVHAPLRLYFSRQFDEAGIALPAGSLRLGEDKSPPFASQFHVAIENCRMPDYFTEKVMDCFQSMTVPIYWGCTNIGDYFNTDGMIIARSLRGLIKACNSVTPELYERMRPAMEDNRERSNRYLDMRERLTKTIRELVVPTQAKLVGAPQLAI